MKKLSEVYKELGIEFTFPIKIKNSRGDETYYEDYARSGMGYRSKYEYDANGNKNYFECITDDCSVKYEYDAHGNVTYIEDSRGVTRGTPRSAKTCEGKVVEVDGIKYELKAL